MPTTLDRLSPLPREGRDRRDRRDNRRFISGNRHFISGPAFDMVTDDHLASLYNIFLRFAAFAHFDGVFRHDKHGHDPLDIGDGHFSDRVMRSTGFHKFVREVIGVQGPGFKDADISLIWLKSCGSARHTMSFDAFQIALKLLAEKRSVTVTVLVHTLCQADPQPALNSRLAGGGGGGGGDYLATPARQGREEDRETECRGEIIREFDEDGKSISVPLFSDFRSTRSRSRDRRASLKDDLIQVRALSRLNPSSLSSSGGGAKRDGERGGQAGRQPAGHGPSSGGVKYRSFLQQRGKQKRFAGLDLHPDDVNLPDRDTKHQQQVEVVDKDAAGLEMRGERRDSLLFGQASSRDRDRVEAEQQRAAASSRLKQLKPARDVISRVRRSQNHRAAAAAAAADADADAADAVLQDADSAIVTFNDESMYSLGGQCHDEFQTTFSSVPRPIGAFSPRLIINEWDYDEAIIQDWSADPVERIHLQAQTQRLLEEQDVWHTERAELLRQNQMLAAANEALLDENRRLNGEMQSLSKKLLAPELKWAPHGH